MVATIRGRGQIIPVVAFAGIWSLFQIHSSHYSLPDAPATNEESKNALRTVKLSPMVEYSASSVEQYIMDNLDKLGYGKDNNPKTCSMWTDPSITTAEVHKKLNAFKDDIEAHTEAIKKFEPIPELMKSIRAGEDIDEVCQKTRLHPDGLRALFPSNELSLSNSGYIEPLLPPLRHHSLCTNQNTQLMTLDYLVHDFEVMCRKLKPHSRLVLLDLGASLDFHGSTQPIMSLINLYEKFGFKFDHIYAFEVTKKDPDVVYGEKLPDKFFHSYHWINVGVTSEKGHKLNPFHNILEKFDADDLIIVKLDIDNSSIEMPLAYQLLEDKDGIYSKLIDQFYFEHHVHLGELAPSWKGFMNGTVKESFELFQNLRKKGIASHSWP